MREIVLKQYLSGEVTIADLVRDLAGAVTHRNDIKSDVDIEDMSEQFTLSRSNVVTLCEAVLSGRLSPEDLSTIAFAIIASDHFEWNDDAISEVLFDWSAPEVNFPLVEDTLRMHRSWLIGAYEPPSRAPISRKNPASKLISVKRKNPDRSQ